MSTDLELESGSRTFAEVIVPLLKEYSTRLRELIQAVVQRRREVILVNAADPDVVAQLLQFEKQQIANILPGYERLARQTSQQLDHGVLDELSRIELEARLADFEAMLATARQVSVL